MAWIPSADDGPGQSLTWRSKTWTLLTIPRRIYAGSFFGWRTWDSASVHWKSETLDRILIHHLHCDHNHPLVRHTKHDAGDGAAVGDALDYHNHHFRWDCSGATTRGRINMATGELLCCQDSPDVAGDWSRIRCDSPGSVGWPDDVLGFRHTPQPPCWVTCVWQRRIVGCTMHFLCGSSGNETKKVVVRTSRLVAID